MERNSKVVKIFVYRNYFVVLALKLIPQNAVGGEVLTYLN